jgi:predicted  nucleic acid-binding Zn-ribbon protein
MDKSLLAIADRTAGPWLNTRDGDLRADRASGRKAASKDLALVQRRHRDFEDGLLGRAKAATLSLRSELTALASDLRRQVDDLARERDEHIGQKLHESREERQRALTALEGKLGPPSARYSAQARTLEQAERDHRSVRAAVGGRLLRRQLVGTYWAVLLLLAVAEVPINRLAFELFFQEQPLFSLILAGAVGIALMFLAHLTGLLVRREPQPPLWKQLRHLAGIVLILLLTGTLVYALASMRQLYVQMLQNEGGSLQQQVESILRGNAATAVSQVASTRLGPAGYTLMVLNITLFAVGAAASFLRHDPHPDYEAAWHGERRSRTRLMRTRARFESRLDAAQKEHDTRIRALDELLRETEARHDQVAAQEAAVGPFFAETLARIANGVRSRSLAFVEGALSALPEGAVGGSIQDIQATAEHDIRRALQAQLQEDRAA